MLLAATQRETTRALIERLAAELQAKWDEAAKAPEAAALEDDIDDSDFVETVTEQDATTESTTLEEMLAASGKRRKKPLSHGPS